MVFSADNFLIAGGRDLETEIINVSAKSRKAFGDLPSKKEKAVGGLLGSAPILCGGDGSGFHDSCFSKKSSSWSQTHTMNTKRSWAAGAQLNDSTLWVIGGSNREGRLDSSEFIVKGQSHGIPGKKLPYPIESHCVVKVSEDKVFVIGGYSSYYTDKVTIFNPLNDFNHIKGPSLLTARKSQACGVMSNGQQIKIVAAGGYNGNYGGGLTSVEIFDTTFNKWISGNKV